MGQFSVEIYTLPGSVLGENQHIKQLIKLRKMEPADREEQETLLDIYKRAMGM